jgi:hypothetical protein
MPPGKGEKQNKLLLSTSSCSGIAGGIYRRHAMIELASQ